MFFKAIAVCILLLLTTCVQPCEGRPVNKNAVEGLIPPKKMADDKTFNKESVDQKLEDMLQVLADAKGHKDKPKPKDKPKRKDKPEADDENITNQSLEDLLGTIVEDFVAKQTMSKGTPKVGGPEYREELKPAKPGVVGNTHQRAARIMNSRKYQNRAKSAANYINRQTSDRKMRSQQSRFFEKLSDLLPFEAEPTTQPSIHVFVPKFSNEQPGFQNFPSETDELRRRVMALGGKLAEHIDNFTYMLFTIMWVLLPLSIILLLILSWKLARKKKWIVPEEPKTGSDSSASQPSSGESSDETDNQFGLNTLSDWVTQASNAIPQHGWKDSD